MKNDGNAVRDRLLIRSQIRDDRVKGTGAEVLAELAEVASLILSKLLEAGRDIAQQFELTIETAADVIIRLSDVLRAESSPVGRFQRHDQIVRRAERGVGYQRDVCRAVQQNVVIEPGCLFQWIDQRQMQTGGFPLFRIRQVKPLDGKITGNAVDVLEGGLLNHPPNVRLDRGIEECVCARSFPTAAQQRRRNIPLLVEIQNQAAFAAFLTHSGDQPAQVGFSHTPFQIERGDDAGR